MIWRVASSVVLEKSVRFYRSGYPEARLACGGRNASLVPRCCLECSDTHGSFLCSELETQLACCPSISAVVGVGDRFVVDRLLGGCRECGDSPESRFSRLHSRHSAYPG